VEGKPSLAGSQVPLAPPDCLSSDLQAKQVAQVLLQQTPSTQCPETHCPSRLQTSPSAKSGWQVLFVGSQKSALAQLVSESQVDGHDALALEHA
jgi:hypothetical protein